VAKLSAKYKRFADEYLIDLNAAQAVLRAGYKAGSDQRAAEIGYQLLQKAPVKDYIAQRQKERSERTEITQDMVLRELAKIGFADIRKAVKWSPTMGEQIIEDSVVQTNGVMLIDSDKIDDDTAAAISEIKQTQNGIAIKMHDKKGALVDIGRHLGMFTDNVNMKGSVTLNFDKHDLDA
jgi:phage terminase small subunit